MRMLPPVPLPPVLTVVPWSPLGPLEEAWHDPRSAYVETYYLPILGPSTTFLARRLADGFDYAPTGFDIDPAEMAAAIGLAAPSSKHSPFTRAVNRLASFDLAAWAGETTLAARRHFPPLTRAAVAHLPAELRARHDYETEPR